MCTKKKGNIPRLVNRIQCDVYISMVILLGNIVLVLGCINI